MTKSSLVNSLNILASIVAYHLMMWLSIVATWCGIHGLTMTVVHGQVEQFQEVLIRLAFSLDCISYQVLFEAPVMQDTAINFPARLCKLKKMSGFYLLA